MGRIRPSLYDSEWVFTRSAWSMRHAYINSFIITVLLGGLLPLAVQGQDSQRRSWRDRAQQPSADNSQEPRRDDRRGPPRDGRGRGWSRTPTPEEREQFYNHMIDRHIERLTRTYNLTEEQQTQVRTRLEELKADQRAYSDARRQESDDLRNQMRQLHESANNGPIDEQRHRELSERMRSMYQDAPLMNPERVTGEIEKLLPAEQAERGRARWTEERAEHDRQHEERRRMWEERRQQEGGLPGSDPQETRRRWMDRRNREGGQDNGPGPDPGWMPGGPPTNERRDWDRRRRPSQENQPLPEDQAVDSATPLPPIRENPISPWEQYVRDFIRRYKLDPSQRATAQSILREMQKRRDAYELSRREDYDATKKIENFVAKQDRLNELNRPVIDLFEELKKRLEPIPTNQQRQAAGELSTISTSQPVTSLVPTSQPAIVSTRPAGEPGQPPSERGNRESRRSYRGGRR